MYRRPMYPTLVKRLKEPRRFIQVLAIEVKSSSRKEGLPGMDAFEKTFKPQRKLLAGGDGIPLEKFLLTPTVDWVPK